MTPEMPGRRGHLAARPRPAVARDVTPGLHQLNLDTGADALLYVAFGIRPTTPASLVLLLHGGATAQHGRNLLVEKADDAGLVLLAPSSQARPGTFCWAAMARTCSQVLIPMLRRAGYPVR